MPPGATKICTHGVDFVAEGFSAVITGGRPRSRLLDEELDVRFGVAESGQDVRNRPGGIRRRRIRNPVAGARRVCPRGGLP